MVDKNEKGVNVQVLLRCRPASEEERRSNTHEVVSCHEQQCEVTVTQSVAGKQNDRIFTFDKVFGPQSQQKELYDQTISSIVNEVLDGFNCTVFAYGQTGTGKTYTMEGGKLKAKNGELLDDAGVIPRAVNHIFESLQNRSADFSVKVTFVELYNEEITDLLAPEDVPKAVDDKHRNSLPLMEDGKGGVVVRGLKEEAVRSTAEIFNLLDRGTTKRRMAETLLNRQSSRSHSVFSVTTHIKEATDEGEDLIKCGKLNLVDLAGSENVSRSGSRESRAREAGEINKSLLTLGRVITSLVEHHAHIPYRDSKLTRLLRDSLGGRTKTCIIATISPSIYCVDETLSTLDYAYRAKSIRNKPEVNQKVRKSSLIKDLYDEIERLKSAVHTAQEESGGYIPYNQFYLEKTEKAMSEKTRQMENQLDCYQKQLDDMRARYDLEHQICKELSTQLVVTQKDLEQTKHALSEAKEDIKNAHDKLDEKDYIILNHQRTEAALNEKATFLCSNLEQSIADMAGLFAKIEHKERIEEGNLKLVRNFQSELSEQMEVLRKAVSMSVAQQQEQLTIFEDELQTFLTLKKNSAEELQRKVQDLKLMYFARLEGLHELAHIHESSTDIIMERAIHGHSSSLQNLLRDAVLEAELVLRDLQVTLLNQQKDIAEFAQRQKNGAWRSIETTRNISQVTLDAFDRLGMQAADLGRCIQKSNMNYKQSLFHVQKTVKVKETEEQLLRNICEVLTESRVNKSSLISSAGTSAMEGDFQTHANEIIHKRKIQMKQQSSILLCQ